MPSNDFSVRNKFIERFFEPQITAYEFLKCFFAFIKKEGTEQIERDLTRFLYIEKKAPENAQIMEGITFRSNGVNYYSDDVEDALFNLQNGGLLGKMNPSFGVLLIKYSPSEVENAINSIPENFQLRIAQIAKDFLNNN